MTEATLNAIDLSRQFGDNFAVKDVSFHLNKGEVLGFLGPNGAGKSTTMRMLTGNLAPTQGGVKICGIDIIENPKEAKALIGYLPEIRPLYKEFTVNEFLSIAARFHKVKSSYVHKAVEAAKDKCGLAHMSNRLIENLSNGYQQRVGIAQAIIHNPEIVILDEPTVGLDPSARRKLLDYLKNKVKTGLTIFYTTHILSEAEYLCDEIAIIDKGKIIAVDSPNALKSRFGKEKTIKIHLLEQETKIPSLLSGIPDCKINFETGTNIIIHSEQSELVLLRVLKILNENNIEIEDLSAVPTNLEDIFLKMVKENASNN